MTLRLWKRFKARIANEGASRVYELVDRPLVGVIAKMEHQGIKVAREALSRLSAEFTAGIAALETEIHEIVGQPFAIVLDNQVISAPVIRQPITTGSGQISGSMNFDEANRLAVLLRAGALPAKLTFLEERTVGPELGQDSIDAGRIASAVAVATPAPLASSTLSSIRVTAPAGWPDTQMPALLLLTRTLPSRCAARLWRTSMPFCRLPIT